MSRSLWFALPAALALACAVQSSREPFRPVTVDEVQRMLGETDVVVVDANVPGIFAEHHLPGARHVGAKPLAALLPADKDARLVFYCTGPR
jgi:rhodanese-related sulfurtransferase